MSESYVNASKRVGRLAELLAMQDLQLVQHEQSNLNSAPVFNSRPNEFAVEFAKGEFEAGPAINAPAGFR